MYTLHLVAARVRRCSCLPPLRTRPPPPRYPNMTADDKQALKYFYALRHYERDGGYRGDVTEQDVARIKAKYDPMEADRRAYQEVRCAVGEGGCGAALQCSPRILDPIAPTLDPGSCSSHPGSWIP